MSKPPIVEYFYTLQGEGYHAGEAAFFIRTAGCDVGCTWCDTKYSWQINPEQYQVWDKIDAEIAANQPKLAVVTGGEPLMHQLDSLTDYLHQHKIYTCLETSGVYPLSGNWDWICLSPKKFKPTQPEIFQQANELKVVIYNKSDFQWAEQNAALVNENCLLYLQAEWSKRNEITPLIVSYIKQFPKWRLSLQTHKYIDIL